jgi:golgin subfamily B member 1
MVAAYQSHHRVQVVEHYEEPVASLAPIKVEADGDVGRAFLIKRIEQLETRIRELEEELRRAQAAINVEVDLSGLEDVPIDATEDPETIWSRVRRNPASAEPLHQLYRVYSARDELDKRWCVAEALVAVGEAKADQRALFEQYQAQTLITPRGGVSPAAWQDLLFHPEEEPLTGQIFGLVAPAMLVGRVTTLRRDKKLHVPDPSSRQDPAKATVTAVRALPWAAAILGLPCPQIYLEKDRDAGYEHIPGVPPFSVVAKRVLTGLTQLEHAFLVGRHVSWYRQEHYIKVLYSAVPDLEDLFLAALTLGSPSLPIADDLKRRVTPIAQAIEPLLEPTQKDALRGCFLRFVEEGGRTNLQRWSLATEKTACRAGLLLCNDLPTALGRLKAEEGGLGELGLDLIAFATSERYFKLRRQLGIAIDQN